MNNTEQNYNDFFSGLSTGLLRELGSDYETKAFTNTRNNGVLKNGILIRHSSESTAPAIYLDEYYEDFRTGKCLNDIIRQVLYTYHDSSDACKRQSFQDIDFSPHAMKDKIILRIVNYTRNSDMLRTMPHLRLFDLAVVFQLMVYRDEDGIGTVKFTGEHFRSFTDSANGKEPVFSTQNELYLLALKNTQRLFPARLSTLSNVLEALLTQNTAPAIPFLTTHAALDSGNDELYVFSNTQGINGSACILYPEIVSRLTEYFQSDFYILPSSIHELLLLPSSNTFRGEELNDMIREINLTQVPREEVLSDRFYYSKDFSRLLRMPDFAAPKTSLAPDTAKRPKTES